MTERRPVPITRPDLGAKELRYVKEVLSSGWLSQGPWVRRLEELWREYTGVGYALAFNSCTSALVAAARIAGVTKGHEVLMPAFTWIATANCAELLGAEPVFADISLETYNIDTSALSGLMTRRTRAVIPVHLFGCPADMKPVRAAARKRRLPIIEDCACSLGGFIGTRHTGRFGNYGCFSLHPRKSLTTGEGGIFVTGSRKAAREAAALRNHGASSSDFLRHHAAASFRLPRYTAPGFNFRMTDLQAAVGVAQFERVEKLLASRRLQASRYTARLQGHSLLRTPTVPPGSRHGWQAYVCLLGPPGIEGGTRKNLEEWGRKRARVMADLEEKGIATRPGTHAVHVQDFYRRKYGFRPMDFPRAYAADRLSIALPIYHGMTRKEQDFVVASLLAAAEKVS